MRARNKGYKDYGIDEEEIKEIILYCRNLKGEEREEVFKWIQQKGINQYVATYIIKSLVDGLSFEKMDKKYNLAMNKEDFYGYRRKSMEAVKRYMLLCRKM